ncbi:MAG: hypothetical protein AAFN79_14420 [Pseudomonadota bacterium]
MRIPAFLIAAAIAAPAFGETDLDTRHEYALSIAGIEIGDVVLEVDAQGEDYAVTIDGGYRFLFWSGAANIVTEGRHSAEGFSPRSYRSRLVSSTREVRTEIDFDEAGVSSADFRSDPPFDPEQFSNRVPVKEGDLLGARDPISSFLIRAADGTEACSGDLQVFSGIVRFDLKLSPMGAAADGADPDRAVCKTEYRPISGHRVESDEVDRLSGEGLDVALFEIAPGLWAPERVGFRTRFGTLALERKAEQGAL